VIKGSSAGLEAAVDATLKAMLGGVPLLSLEAKGAMLINGYGVAAQDQPQRRQRAERIRVFLQRAVHPGSQHDQTVCGDHSPDSSWPAAAPWPGLCCWATFGFSTWLTWRFIPPHRRIVGVDRQRECETAGIRVSFNVLANGRSVPADWS